MDRVSAVIVNFNGERYLPELLTSLAEQRHSVDEVIIVDNASTDRSIQIAEQFAVHVVRAERNAGPAAARNMGLRRAKHDLVLHLDNDTVVHPDALGHLVHAANTHPAHTFFVPRTLFDGDRQRIQKDDLVIHFLGISLNSRNYDVVKRDAMPIDANIRGFNGVAYLMKRGAREIADYDEAFFYGLEDVDFSIHNYLIGHRFLYVPQAEIYHKEGTPGLSYRSGRRTYPSLRLFYLARNRWFVMLKHFQAETLALLIPLNVLFDLAVFVFAVLHLGSGLLLPRAYVSVFSNANRILAERRKIQRTRQLSDRELLLNHGLKFNRQTHERAPRTMKAMSWLVQLYGRYVLRLADV